MINLNNDRPLMIARFGSIEIKGVLYGKYPYLFWPLKKIIFNRLRRNAGFFSCDEDEVKKFSKMMIEDMKLVDILGSWRIEEYIFNNSLKRAKKIPLKFLEPYFSDDPWSFLLEGKKVLVIHPFAKTIEHQYKNNRKVLFKDPRILPEFKSLQTIKAVQTIAGVETEFLNWFEALEFMKRQIEEVDFDVAIIGCGAYGFPLAAHIKRLGKQSIHLGGATQILFGIRGKRWEENENFKTILNEHFVRPAIDDVPKNADTIEGGCYW